MASRPPTMTFGEFVQICCHGKLDDVHAALDDNPDFITHHDPERLNRTALIELCISGKRHDVINVLIARGADVNALDDKGQTALHHVMEISSAGTQLVTTLVAAGSDEKIVDSNNHDVHRIARILAHPDYKEAFNVALAERSGNQALQTAADAQVIAQQENALQAAINTRMQTIRTLHAQGGKRFKL